MDDPIIQHIMTLCMFQKGDEFLRLDRQHDDFTGFIPRELRLNSRRVLWKAQSGK